MSETKRYDVAVAGGGIVGLSAALAAGQAGADVALVDRRPAPRKRAASDGRTAALLDPAITFLDRLGAWPELVGDAAPLDALRIVNLNNQSATNADVTFQASEVGLGAFGYNIPNDSLSRALFEKCAEQDAITLIANTSFSHGDVDDDQVILNLDNGMQVEVRLLVAADGRRSAVRQALRIDMRIHDYKQSAIVCSFDHDRPHDTTSIELHWPGGPFTMVPLPGQRSSLVWVEPTEKADELMALDEVSFRRELEIQASPWLGHVGGVSARRCYPLSAVLATSLTAPRTVLIGEAAHALSPIGAQGLNLSLQDVSHLGDLISEAIRTMADPGAAALLQRYSKKRMPDIRARFHAVDGLNRMVASDWRMIGLLRAAGLQTLGKLPFMRRGLMRAMMRPLELSDVFTRMAA
ncbi:MAG: FAD-dependent oxidoreductase [Alphaproteobacteria bacterium]|nr:FAD-dependent oxidoreductase [Alphaproteobacteria bacterium]